MAWPEGITTRTVNFGPAVSLERGEGLTIKISVKASRRLVWAATGTPLIPEGANVTGDQVEASLELPVTDQPGYVDGKGGSIDVADGKNSHYYTATIEYLRGKQRVSTLNVNPFTVPTGDGSPIDLDLLLPATTGGVTVSVPDTWSATLAQAQAAADEAAASLAAAKWQPATLYAAGAVTQAPDGSTVRRLTEGTSGAVFDAGEQAAWEAVAAAADTVAGQSLKATFALKGEAGGKSRSASAHSTAAKLTDKKVVLIFRHDDLQESQLNYLDEYAARDIKASFYITSDFVGTTGYLTEQQLRDIYAAGHDVGSHSVSHPRFDTLATEAERRAELADSKAWIEGVLRQDDPSYVCEVFAWPGNVVVEDELFDYYMAGLADTGTPSIHGPIFMAGHPASLADIDWVDDASIAATQTKVASRLAALKAVNPDGTAVDVIQAHNETEMSDEQLAAMLDVCAADPDVVILTMGEWLHYVRETYQSLDGRWYSVGGRANARQAVIWETDEASASPFTSDRRGTGGKAFRALVNGDEKGYVDDHFAFTDGSRTSRFESGHKLQFYAPTGGIDMLMQQEDSAFTMRTTTAAGVGKGTFILRGRTWQRFNGVDAFAVQTEAAATVFGVNTSRQTMRLAVLGALPTGTATAGEMCIVNGVLYVCTAAGNPGTWAIVGTQA